MSLSIVQQVHPTTNLARLYLRIAGRNIWLNQKIADTLQKVDCISLDEVRVIRYQTPRKIMFYLEYNSQSSLLSSEDAAFILKAQGQLSPELADKPTEFVAKTLISLTAQQIPYWIDDWWVDGSGDEIQFVPYSAKSQYTRWFGVDYRGHRLAKYKTRAEAVKLMRTLFEIGQPTVQNGELAYETCGFRIRTLNWEKQKWYQPEYVNNPCRAFVCWETKPLRTQFANQCRAIVISSCRALIPIDKKQYTKYASPSQAAEILNALNAVRLPEELATNKSVKAVKTAKCPQPKKGKKQCK